MYIVTSSTEVLQHLLYSIMNCKFWGVVDENNALHLQSAFSIHYYHTTRNIFWVTGFSPVVFSSSLLAAFSSSMRIISSLASSSPKWV